MFYILSWILFGLFVGVIAKFVHPGKEPVGFLSSIVAGIVGSFIGGSVNYLVAGSLSEFSPAGLFMSVVGAVAFFAFLHWLSLKNVE